MKILGSKGEDLASSFLKKLGYRIIKRNYKTPTGEIDIIAEDGDTLVFVEVKTRRDNLFGSPEEAVDYRKKTKIKNTALCYISKLRRERPARFDIISIYLKDGRKTIEHIKDAFEITR